MAPLRPAFAESYPRTPELDALVSAFTDGNYRHVRTEAPRLAEATDDADVKAAAIDLRSRLDADPWAIALLALTAALLLFLSVYWMLHDGGHVPPASSTKPQVETVH